MNVVGGRAQTGLFSSDAQAGKPGVLTLGLLPWLHNFARWQECYRTMRPTGRNASDLRFGLSVVGFTLGSAFDRLCCCSASKFCRN